MEQSNAYDVIIIGGGPVGMFGAFYAGLRNLKVLLLESLAELGGQPAFLYPEKTILDVAGYSKISGKTLIQQLQDQTTTLPVEIQTNQTVTNVKQLAQGFEITTDQQTLLAKTVVIATGRGAFSPRRLQIEHAEQFEGHGLTYLPNALESYRDLDVAVAGGGDSAVELATELAPIAKSVSLIHRRDKFRALEYSVEQLEKTNVAIKYETQITALDQAGSQLQLTLNSTKQDQIDLLTVDELIVSYGFTSSDEVLNQWDVQLEKSMNGFSVTRDFQSSIAGIYVVGDAAVYPGKADLMATGFGEVPAAINAAVSYMDPDRGGPVHSTSQNIIDGKIQ